LYQAFRDVTWDLEQARNDFHRIAVEADEHMAIVDALGNRDSRAAVRAMTAHMKSGVRYWLQVSTNLDNAT
jgi:DNA-binding FadR family transcriptional regulator